MHVAELRTLGDLVDAQLTDDDLLDLEMCDYHGFPHSAPRYCTRVCAHAPLTRRYIYLVVGNSPPVGSCSMPSRKCSKALVYGQDKELGLTVPRKQPPCHL
jgi:hypothetical protein|eukprot:COSAG01_NODE_11561_length_1903_cov_1.876386_2_plen_101_part_00